MRLSLEHGIAVLATGASELRPNEYCYGEDPRILTNFEVDVANQVTEATDYLDQIKNL